MLDYLKVFEQRANLFPGFEAEVRGSSVPAHITVP